MSGTSFSNLLGNVLIDKNKINAFWSARTKVEDRRLATNYRDDGRLGYDTELVKKYVKHNSSILDLGAGTCTLTAPFLDIPIEKVVAVDRYEGFLNKVPDHPLLTKICADVAQFYSTQIFDLILLFGVVNFLSHDEELSLYESCSKMMAEDSVFIVKNQCGIANEVLIDKFSEELGTHYHARYPHFEDQFSKLSTFFKVELVDIYPNEINRWEDTHFYAFICTLKQ